MNKLLKWYVKFKTNMSGASAVEYAILVALIALVIIGAVTALGLNIGGAFQKAADTLGTIVEETP
jgi:pilus assembly protein Flp/PilA